MGLLSTLSENHTRLQCASLVRKFSITGLQSEQYSEGTSILKF